MNKRDLARAVADSQGISLAAADRLVDGVLEVIERALRDGEEVRLAGFGTFTTVMRAARTGRNPRTGAVVEVPASRTPKFKPASALKSLVQGTGASPNFDPRDLETSLAGDPTTDP